MSSHNIQDNQSNELSLLLKNWAAKYTPPEDSREKLLRVVAHSQMKRRPNRFIVFVQGLTRPYWVGRPKMSYAELSKWLFNRAIIESLGSSYPELRLVT